MRFENTFDVEAPPDEVFDALLDVERVAPCMPGAEVLERTGEDAYKVGIKVKLGPMAMKYRGQVEVIEKDPENRRAVMRVKAKEARGQGIADAKVHMSLTGDGSTTNGKLEADVQLSGKAAAMGQGMIQDVSATLVETFAHNLAAMLSGGGPQAAPEAAAAGSAATAASAPSKPATGEPATAASDEADTGDPGRPAAAGPPKPESPPPAGAESSLSLPAIAGSVAKRRLRDPKSVAAIVALALGALLLWRR
ncbi:MAG: SRPBCC family protein [Actinomycetota bacterium]|nr:SRPBCC family protein [Actinomycetota bacterium]